ncbi:hydrogenase maturation nickel metallochaperone HypA [Brenneria roseae subsp. americana]|uniref:Hydrogenase maturation factor HypA n=1 Tax=Brenneria roseae subsp. americana TaxID=1508507 RepID=A0A2U1TLF0_9GAMM|nr:hydrogenase maturation nickel metallochaperone HypA [Brenneria roseae]PWC10237.1 hydrogenase maturation nickel metallochaperone HypA [Brenneria roseae subsp. americana]
MHEISMCYNALELIEQQARQHQARRVTEVWLEVGALSCIEESALRFCFESVCRQTLAEGCQLHVAIRPAKAWCWECSAVVEILKHDEGCPQCGSHNLRVDDGDSLQIKQLAIE